jgi:beta-lactamase class A
VTIAAASPTPSTTRPPSTTPTTARQTPTAALTVPTVASQPAPSVADPALEALLQNLLGNSQGSYGIYVKNLKDGAGASINPDKAFHAASLAKLFIMWEAFRQESLGLISFDDTMDVTPYYKSFELGTNAVEVGDLVTVDEALRLMTSISDTPTSVLLQDTLGVANINQSLEALGIENSGLFYPSNPVATARDVGVLLEAIARGGILPQASHDAMIALLLSARTDNGLRTGVPAEIDVAHKTGTLAMALHDAGIVYLPGEAYVLVVLWDRQSGSDLIQTISRRVYQYFAAQN